MSIHIALASVAGKSGRRSQDSVLFAGRVNQGRQTCEVQVDEPGAILAVAAGIWPSRLGARASRLAIELLTDRLGADAELSEVGIRAVQRSMGERARGTRNIGMATTLAALQINGGTATVVNVGDSPVYRWRNGFLCPKSVDHTVARRMVNEGVISRDDEMAAAGYYDNLDSALYADPFADRFDVHEAKFATESGDLWLVCSRGIRRHLTSAKMAELVRLTYGNGPGAVALCLATAAATAEAPGVDVTVAALQIA